MMLKTASCLLVVLLISGGCNRYRPVTLTGSEQIERAANAYQAYEPPRPRVRMDGPPVITLSVYTSTEIGATYDEVAARIGDPGRLVSSEQSMAHGGWISTYMWENPDLSSATLVFVSTRLANKSADGLK